MERRSSVLSTIATLAAASMGALGPAIAAMRPIREVAPARKAPRQIVVGSAPVTKRPTNGKREVERRLRQMAKRGG